MKFPLRYFLAGLPANLNRCLAVSFTKLLPIHNTLTLIRCQLNSTNLPERDVKGPGGWLAHLYDGCQGCLQLRKTGQPRVHRGTSNVKVQWDRRTYPLISDAPVDTLPPLMLPVTPPYCVVLPLYILTSRDEPLSLTLNSNNLLWFGNIRNTHLPDLLLSCLSYAIREGTFRLFPMEGASQLCYASSAKDTIHDVGSLGTSVFDTDVYLVGASGGVYALLAAHLANVLLNYNNMEFGIVRLIGIFIIEPATGIRAPESQTRLELYVLKARSGGEQQNRCPYSLRLILVYPANPQNFSIQKSGIPSCRNSLNREPNKPVGGNLQRSPFSNEQGRCHSPENFDASSCWALNMDWGCKIRRDILNCSTDVKIRSDKGTLMVPCRQDTDQVRGRKSRGKGKGGKIKGKKVSVSVYGPDIRIVAGGINRETRHRALCPVCNGKR
ncbi:hypothetical protein KQX54_020758 [Cotesia glomerata]|uniref:Peptidase S54 rhomboid domain-containing protein n=1 Tax=Cotesia glomerata TaxID=32391 RepID=A0AAV7I501_COTGL|nr:hypothetical protein KQX54_020758 [Cotesia glomerata]